jgi:UDP-N-acetylmuramoylalanine--D-glutamate ligase
MPIIPLYAENHSRSTEMEPQDFKNMNVTVMGLGLNGGGVASVRFLAEQGARVTATDLRSAAILAPTIDSLKDLDIRYVLNEHRMEDFEKADLVIKNPAVPASSPFLAASGRVETDLSLFLSLCSNPILAVTGSKGKSTVVSALHHILKARYPGCRLGGNITVSPLSFLKELQKEDPVILELSSWQLGDLKGRDLLHPEISVLTNIMNDHQNMYNSFEDYVDDKRVIYQGQTRGQHALFLADERGRSFASDCKARSWFYGSTQKGESELYMQDNEGLFHFEGKEESLLPPLLKTPGFYFRQNCLIAAGVARLFGEKASLIRSRLEDYPGIPHRLELVARHQDIHYYNDTTSTIPEAMAAGIQSFDSPLHLICGGTDKELDYREIAPVLSSVQDIYLLEGTASTKIISILQESGKTYWGPISSL